MTVVTPTDRHKLVRNCCVIDVLVAFLCCPLVFEFSDARRVFVIGLSRIFFFFSLVIDVNMITCMTLHSIQVKGYRNTLFFYKAVGETPAPPSYEGADRARPFPSIAKSLKSCRFFFHS